MKRNCLNCHFLCLSFNDSGRELRTSLSKTQRETLVDNPKRYRQGSSDICCHMGVWDTGVAAVYDVDCLDNFSQDRGGECFFFPYRQSMLLLTAVEIQKRQEAHSRFSKTDSYARWGLWFAAAGLFLTAIYGFFGLV